MSDTLRQAAQQALEALESLQGGCTDSGDGTVEAITVWCPEVIDALRAALAEPAGDTLPPLPEPAGFRTRYRSEPGMIGHYPWTYADQGRRRIDRPECEYENLFAADQMRSYAAAALAAAVAEPVASVTECEACFTPDVCQLRGTCDHYAAERLRVAAPPQREPLTDAESRAAFEAFAQDCPMGHYSIDTDTRPGRAGQYRSMHTQTMWDAWQAAIAHERAHGIAPASAPKEQA